MKERRLNFYCGEEIKRALLENFIYSGLDCYEIYFIYNSFGAEAPTDGIIKYLLDKEKTVLSPVVRGGNMFSAFYSADTLKGAFGIDEPSGSDIYYGKIDVALLPMLAVDGFGHRLGYGGGYYDRFLRDRVCLKVAYGFDFQLTDYVPHEIHDVRADAILTEIRYLRSKDEE